LSCKVDECQPLPVSLCAMKPPTMKLVAIPIWFALIATEVARV